MKPPPWNKIDEELENLGIGLDMLRSGQVSVQSWLRVWRDRQGFTLLVYSLNSSLYSYMAKRLVVRSFNSRN